MNVYTAGTGLPRARDLSAGGLRTPARTLARRDVQCAGTLLLHVRTTPVRGRRALASRAHVGRHVNPHGARGGRRRRCVGANVSRRRDRRRTRSPVESRVPPEERAARDRAERRAPRPRAAPALLAQPAPLPVPLRRHDAGKRGASHSGPLRRRSARRRARDIHSPAVESEGEPFRLPPAVRAGGQPLRHARGRLRLSR